APATWAGRSMNDASPAIFGGHVARRFLPPTLAPKTRGANDIDDEHGAREQEPRDRVLQVAVGKLEASLAAFGEAAGHIALLGLEEERRGVHGGGRKHRKGHAVQIAPEPAIGLRLVVGREEALLLREPDEPRHLDLTLQLTGRTGRRIAQLLRHEASVDQDEVTRIGAERREDVPARFPVVGEGIEVAFLAVVVAAFDAHAVVAWVLAGTRRADRLLERDRRPLGSHLDLGDQPFLPGETLQLPDPEPDQERQGEEREQSEPDEAFARHGKGLLRGEPALFGLVPELEGNEDALEGTEQHERQDDRERTPKKGVQPIRRRVEHLDNERRAAHDEARHQDDEDGGSIARIGEVIVEPARIAARCEAEIAVEQLAAPAGGTMAGDPRP